MLATQLGPWIGDAISKLSKWTISAGVGSVAAFAVFALLLQFVGLFDFTGTDASAKVVSAAIALLGGFVASVVAFVGILLTYWGQRRSEQRQKAEAMLKAVGLLTTPTGAAVTIEQRAGILFALNDLEAMPLAVAMLEQQLAANSIDSNTAAQVTNAGLQSGNKEIAGLSARVLLRHAGQLASASGDYALPESVDMRWPLTLPESVREQVSLGRMRLIRSQPRKKWSKDAIFSHTAAIATTWRLEIVERIKRDNGLFLNGLVGMYEDGDKTVLYAPDGEIRIAELRKELAGCDWTQICATQLGTEFTQGIAEWAEGASPHVG